MLTPPPQNYLRTYRKKAGLSLEELAFLVGVEFQRAWDYEHSRYTPSLPLLLAYQQVLRVPIEKLYPDVNEQTTRLVRERVPLLREKLAATQGAKNEAKLNYFQQLTTNENSENTQPSDSN